MSIRKRPGGEKNAEKLKHRGFYAALYSCVGVMLALAVIIGYTNLFRNGTEDYDGMAGLPYELPDIGIAEADTEDVPDYQAQAETIDPLFDYDAAAVAGGREEAYYCHYCGHYACVDGACAEAVEYMAEGYGELDYRYSVLMSDEDLEAWRRRNQELHTPDPEEQQPSPTPEPEPPRQEEAFHPFNQYADNMAWPLVGDIVMNYSTNRLIFDSTLEQFRTNDNICIAANIGDPVGAAAAGVVTEVHTTRERGKTVVVDHGNGWRTTYSQLQDEVSVQAGDVVAKGQKIGTVAAPTLFSSQLGPHVAFTVHREQDTVDPRTVLAQY